MTLHAEIANARRTLEQAGISPIEAAVDADLLARAVLGWDRARLLASLADPAPPHFHAAYAALVARRQRREPAAYIVGSREFWGRDFEVGPGVLVPRPETELIVEEALARLAGRMVASFAQAAGPRHPVLIADAGTGSGCLAVTLALELPRARIVATDMSAAALNLARRNATRHETGDRIDFLETNVLADVDACFDLIVSNPPYVPASEMPHLSPEVRDYEPREALWGGADGLDLIRELLLQAESRLKENGLLIFEFGFGQETAVSEAIASRPAFRLATMRRDLQGIPRTAVVRWQPPTGG
jgi:release factor glutamine methyltransferase